MKSSTLKTAAAGFAVLTGMLALGPGAAQAAPAKAIILRDSGDRETGFIQNSNDRQILFSVSEDTPGAAVNLSSIKGIAFLEKAEIMAPARTAFERGQYEQAATLLGAVADEYGNLAFVPDNFASEARFLQMECLRRLGKYQEMAALFETPSGKTFNTTLPDLFKSQLALNRLWTLYGAGNWDELKQGLSGYETPQVGKAKMLGAPALRSMPGPEVVQVAFLRAKLYEREDKASLALDDYSRCLTLSYGNDHRLSGEALMSAMALMAKDPALADNKAKMKELEGLSFLYKTAYGKGEVPEPYASYAGNYKPADPPAIKTVKEKAEPASEPEGDKKAEPTKADAKKGKKKAADKKAGNGGKE